MTKRKFLAKRAVAWHRFEELLERLDTVSLRRFTPAETAEFSRLFRELCHDLSLIRSRDWGRGLIAYLNDLVSRGHNAFYSAPPGNLAQLARFLAVGFPQLFRRNVGYFLAAALIFFGTLGISWAVVQHDPALARRIIPPDQLKMFDEMYSDDGPLAQQNSKSKKQNEDLKELGSFGQQRALMAGFYVNHNTGIALDAFGRGILFGVGTVYTLIENGVFIGAVAGFLVSAGHGGMFLSFAVSHSSFELVAIAVAGGAGLMLGNALVHPGRRSRLESLRIRGLEAIQIACGAGAMLFVAALIEGFWSPAPIPAGVKYAGGALLWVLVIVYLSTAGRWDTGRGGFGRRDSGGGERRP